LPYRQKIIHARWSGEACWVPLGECDLGVGFEDATSVPQAGEILFYPGGYSETEILFTVVRKVSTSTMRSRFLSLRDWLAGRLQFVGTFRSNSGWITYTKRLSGTDYESEGRRFESCRAHYKKPAFAGGGVGFAHVVL